MSDRSYIQLKTSAINNIPFQSYDEFTFIVNEKEYKTTRIISDLLSPKICQLHINDPTINQYIIKTKHKGDFSQFLNLVNFERIQNTHNNYDFFMEVIEKLGNQSIEFSFQGDSTKITNENVFKLLSKHEKYPLFFSKKIDDEIDFISSHFYELFDSNEQYQKLQSFELETIEQIIDNSKIKLIDEDQLLTVINKLYSNDSKYSILYEYVDFKLVDTKTMKEFISVFDINDINSKIWKKITKRLNKIVNSKNKMKNENKRYFKKVPKKSSSKNQPNDPFLNDPFANVHESDSSDSVNPFHLNRNHVNDRNSNRRNVSNDPFTNQQNVHRNNSSDSDDPFHLNRSHVNDRNSNRRNMTNPFVDPFLDPPKVNLNDPFSMKGNISTDSNDPFSNFQPNINLRNVSNDPFIEQQTVHRSDSNDPFIEQQTLNRNESSDSNDPFALPRNRVNDRNANRRNNQNSDSDDSDGPFALPRRDQSTAQNNKLNDPFA